MKYNLKRRRHFDLETTVEYVKHGESYGAVVRMRSHHKVLASG